MLQSHKFLPECFSGNISVRLEHGSCWVKKKKKKKNRSLGEISLILVHPLEATLLLQSLKKIFQNVSLVISRSGSNRVMLDQKVGL